MEITWTEEANSNLKKIYEYITKENYLAADETLDGIFNKVQLLVNHPTIGYIYKKQNSKEIRIILYGHYRIAYTYLKNINSITILGVYHGAMDITNSL